MKKLFALLAATLVFLLSGCGSPDRTPPVPEPDSSTQAEQTTVPQTETTTAAFTVPRGLPTVDVDLSSLSGNMMYSQVYDMIYNPDQYLGKTVRICAPVNRFADEETGREHCVCIIQDATACCTQGIEFETVDPNASVPQDGDTVLVSGTFDTYMNGPFLYCVLRDAVLEYPTTE